MPHAMAKLSITTKRLLHTKVIFDRLPELPINLRATALPNDAVGMVGLGARLERFGDA